MRENQYQHYLMGRINHLLPRSIVVKNDTHYVQGIPDLLVLYEDKWAMLEVKRSADAPEQPNQRHYVEMFDRMSFAAFIFPENEDEVLDALQQAFGIERPPRLFEP